jgi:hypothetical protein
MKKTTVILLVLILFVIATPVAAKVKVLVGERVYLGVLGGGSPTTEFSADEPFHILHGWRLAPGTKWINLYNFELDLDGVRVEEDFILRWSETGDLIYLNTGWVYNFPDGMPAGEYVFTGHWYGPCQPLVDNGDYAGPCAQPNEVVEALMLVIPIIFFE